MRGSPSDSSRRNAIGSLPSSLAISSRKHSAAKALWPLPTPRHGASRVPPGLDHMLRELVRDRILRDRRAFHHDPVDGRRLAARHGRRIGDHRFRHDAVVPRDHLAAGVEAGLDVVRGHRPEFAEGDVVLAAPDQLHRPADRLRQANRIEHHLLLAAAAEPAAQQVLMQGDLRSIGLQQPGDLAEQAGWHSACLPRFPPTCRQG